MTDLQTRLAIAPKAIISAAVVVVNEAGEVLLVQSPRRGWEHPGGQVEEHEPIRAAAIREVKEESGIEIELTRFCGIFQNLNLSIFNTLFLGRPIGGELQTSKESLAVGYFSLAKVKEMVTYSNFLDRILMCLDEATQPFLVEF